MITYLVSGPTASETENKHPTQGLFSPAFLRQETPLSYWETGHHFESVIYPDTLPILGVKIEVKFWFKSLGL